MGRTYTRKERLELAEERGILVDEQDMWLIEEHTWSVDNYGYVYTSYMGKPMKLHHCIIGMPIWEGDVVDHLNRNRQNNQRHNLGMRTKSENTINRTYVDQARLVHYDNKTKLFVFQVQRNGIRLAECYKTEPEAIAARDKWLAMQEK